jgi:hypothetical protein
MNSGRWRQAALCLALVEAAASCGTTTPSATGGQNSEITSGSTTCALFAAGVAPPLGQIRYSVNGVAITGVNPDAFYYWVKVVPSKVGLYRVTITQSTKTASQPVFAANANGVFDKSSAAAGECEPLSSTMTHPTGRVTAVTFSGSKGTTFYIGVKFSTSAAVGRPALPSGPIKVLFSTTGVNGSTSEVDLVKT